jgi:hypothetical protein
MFRVTMCFAFALATSAGCLRSTEFKCRFDADCGTTGVCETVGYCSFPSLDCPSGRSYSDSAGQGLSSTCVPASNPVIDAGVDAPMIDTPPPVGCPAPYAPVVTSTGTSTHVYKPLTGVTWDTAKLDCGLTSASAYLAIPDDAQELMDLATVAMGTPFWIGIDDQAVRGTFVTVKGTTPPFLPWAAGQPDQSNPPKLCVNAISATEIATEKCGTLHIAVCECEP